LSHEVEEAAAHADAVDPLWNPVAEVDHDSKVDGTDIALVTGVFGEDP
jgi:hypothetical protein